MRAKNTFLNIVGLPGQESKQVPYLQLSW